MAKIDMSYKGDKRRNWKYFYQCSANWQPYHWQKQVNIPANYTVYDDDIFSDKKMVFEEDYPNVEVVRNANITQPYLIIKNMRKVITNL